MDRNPYYVAGTERRILAFLVDEVLRQLAYLPAWVHLIRSSGYWSFADISWFWLGICYLFHFSARVVFLRFIQATPGKFLFGLRLVGRESDDLNWTQAFVRTAADDLAAVAGLATRCLALLRFDRTHLSDWVAGTRLIQNKHRIAFPHRRWILAIFLFVVTGISGLQNSLWWLAELSGERGVSHSVSVGNGKSHDEFLSIGHFKWDHDGFGRLCRQGKLAHDDRR